MITNENASVSHSNLIACIWDFDKTLIPGYMQKPLFDAYGIDEDLFWEEVRALPEIYRKQGIHVSEDLLYLNHILSYVKAGNLRGLTNSRLRELGGALTLFPGLPDFFKTLKNLVTCNERYAQYGLQLEHYIISCGFAEMIRGSKIAPYVDGIFGCEYIEDPMLPNFLQQENLPLERNEHEISQIGCVIDNTTKTRCLFEINKGVNKHANLNVNSSMLPQDRRIPIENMIYIADGPSDVPMFAVLRERGGKAFAVHNPESNKEFIQNDELLHNGRVDCYGPADYRPGTPTYRWLTLHVEKIAENIIQKREQHLLSRIKEPPSHQHKELVTINQQMGLEF